MSVRDPELEPFGEEGELARLLAAERDAPPPAPEVGARVWSRVDASLGAGPRFPTGKAFLIVAAVGAAAAIGWRAFERPPAPTAVPRPAAPPAPMAALASPSPSAPLSTSPSASPATSPATSIDRRSSRTRAIDPLGAERALVDRAREALAHGVPRDAAALLDEHARRYPRGQLREERESLAVRAALTLGRPAEARARGEAFLRSDPDSLFAPGVRVLVGRTRPLDDGPPP